MLGAQRPLCLLLRRVELGKEWLSGGTLYQSVVCLVEEQEEVKTAGLGAGRAGSRAKGSRQQPVTLRKDRGTFFKC